MPLLDRYGFRATVFVTTGWVEDAGPLRSGHRPGTMLSWSQITEAADARDRGRRPQPPASQAGPVAAEALFAKSCTSSKAQLEDRLGSPVAGLAYPFGYSSARVRRGGAPIWATTTVAPSATSWPETDPNAIGAAATHRPAVDGDCPSSGRSSRGKDLERIFLKDRALTKGWAMVRRTRAAVGGMSRGR